MTRGIPTGQWIRERDRQLFHSEGYMVIPNVVSRNITSHAAREIAAFVDADLADYATWYGGAPELDGVVPLHHAQSLWEIRQCPDLHQVFTEFFRNPRLMVDINRCIFCPPGTSGLAGDQSWKHSLGYRPAGAGSSVIAGCRSINGCPT